jgi:hypothetical protein
MMSVIAGPAGTYIDRPGTLSAGSVPGIDATLEN